MKKFSLTFVLSAILLTASSASASAWPATDSTGTDIGTAWLAADSSIEPSGIVWSAYENAFVVVSDEGQVALIASDGTLGDYWDLGSAYDLEDVTIIDNATALVYLLDENNTIIREFNTDTGALTGTYWDASATITEGSDGLGAEGLTWVPDGYSSLASGTSGGHFYVGWQLDGDVYVFDVDLAVSGAATYVEEIHMTSGYTDISGLFWSTETERFYALYDGLNIVEERSADGLTLYASYDLPSGHDEEGIALVTTSATTATMSIAEDVSAGTAQILSYTGYPIVLADPDGDADGVPASADCNDSDASVSVESVYYADNDSDGLGDAASSTSVCEATAPSGYVNNSSDANDDDADNDSVSSGTDCDDGDSSVSVLATYYADADSDTLGDSAAPTSVCETSAPVGYVTNDDDTNDAIPNYGIEIDDDLVDNDFDAVIDEVNRLRDNGAHPYYSTLAPADTTLFGASIVRVSGMRNGQYCVRYGDNSVYVYRALSNRVASQTRTRVIDGSGYVLVKNPRRVAIVNALTGSVVAVRNIPATRARMAAWVLTVTGLTL